MSSIPDCSLDDAYRAYDADRMSTQELFCFLSSAPGPTFLSEIARDVSRLPEMVTDWISCLGRKTAVSTEPSGSLEWEESVIGPHDER